MLNGRDEKVAVMDRRSSISITQELAPRSKEASKYIYGFIINDQIVGVIRRRQESDIQERADLSIVCLEECDEFEDRVGVSP